MKRFILLVLLTACTLEPPYRRPAIDTACAWREEASDVSTLCNLRWWEEMGDPVLDALVEAALLNNNDLKVAVWRVCEFYARYQVARSPLFPQVDLEATALKERFPVQASFLPVGFDPITPFYSYDFNLSWEIDFWGKIRSGAHAAYDEALAQVQNRRTVVLTLVSAVAQAYVELRELDRELQISLATLEERKEYLHIAILRFEGGLTSEIEVTQAASAYDETLSAVTILREQIPQQENLISVLIGLSSEPICRGRALEDLLIAPEIPAGLPCELLERRPDILSAELSLYAALSNVGVARANFFPQISLTGLFGGQSFDLSTLFSPASRAWHIGADLLQPLFTGGSLTGQLKEARAIAMEAVYNYKEVALNAFKEVNDALIALKQSKELVRVQKNRVEWVKEYLHLAWLRYYNGQTDYLTVLDAERQVYLAEIDLARAEGMTLVAMIDLYKALGGGWVVDADCSLRE